MAGDGERSETPDSVQGAINLGGDADKLAEYYNRWADTYDADLERYDYAMPAMIVETLSTAITMRTELASLADRSAAVVDAGCGTGLVGKQLQAAGYENLHGLDLSAEMIRVAEGLGIYRSLRSGVDLTATLAPDLVASADIVTIGGVLTTGHVPPTAIANIVRLIRPGGLLVASTRSGYHDLPEFVEVIERLRTTGVFDLVHHVADAAYTAYATGDYWAFLVA